MFQAKEYSEVVYKEFISCLHAKSNALPNVPSIVRGLVLAMAKKTPLDSHTTITGLLDYFWDLNQADVCIKLCWRFLDHRFLTATSITKVLIPLIPELVTFLGRRQVVLTTDPYRTVFKNIMFAWASQVLGMKPADASPYIALALRNPCPCEYCRKVVAFLTSNNAVRSLNLHSIGAPKRRHVEQQLTSYGGSAVASWTTISTSPQGITVSLYHPFLFK